MKRRIYDNKSKASIELEGLQGRSVAILCNEYQITQSMYYRWRDTFLSNAAQAFETGTTNRREERLTGENQKPKQGVDELTLELKKRLVSGRRRTGQVQRGEVDRTKQIIRAQQSGASLSNPQVLFWFYQDYISGVEQKYPPPEHAVCQCKPADLRLASACGWPRDSCALFLEKRCKKR